MNAPQNIAMDIDASSADGAVFDEPHIAVRSSNRNAISRFFGGMQMADKMAWYSNSIIALFVMFFACTFVEDYVPALQGWGRPTAFVVSVVGLGWVILVKHATKQDIVLPITKVANEMSRLSQGARDIEITGTRRQDELGDLARALDSFTQDYARLDKLLAEAEATDQVKEDAAAERQRELVRIATEFETSIGEIAGSVASAATQLSSTAADMAKTAHGSSETAQSVADAMKRASDVATAAAVASDEFALSIDEISRQATQSEQFARDAATSADGTDANISALSESAEEISQVLELIQTIANRTNLLALNASIEAARGGDSGRGFAVVASEVKELAHQTSAATNKVGQQIEAMQDSTKSSVAQLRNVAKHIHDLERTSVSIASAVDQQSVAGKELARNIDVSARETGEVASYAKDLLEKATGVGSAADQLLASSKELDMQASKLTAQAQSFIKRIRQN